MHFAKYLVSSHYFLSCMCVCGYMCVYHTVSLLLGLWWDKPFLLSGRPLRLCPFFPIIFFFPLRFSDWIVCISIYILFLAKFKFILSSVIITLVLNSPYYILFLFQLLYFPFKKLPVGFSLIFIMARKEIKKKKCKKYETNTKYKIKC